MPETTIPATVSYSTHTYHQYTLKLSGEINRDKLLAELQKKGIPANVYYPLPVHQQNAYKNYETRCCDLSVTEELNKVVISLPIHTEMDEEQLNFICTSVLQFIKQEETIKANI
jgi:UDP-2-acetamido-2-deoxy-ribo-hexuluronate aminotransferase